MARIKRVKATDSTDGAWQSEQLRLGWYTKDYDFSTNEFVMGRCEDIKTITPRQARLLAYNSAEELSDAHIHEIWGE
jgi:hypothetical protein